MKNKVLLKFMDILPQRIKLALEKVPENTLNNISEIRLRAENITTVTILGENLYLSDTGIQKVPIRCVQSTFAEIDAFIYRLCEGSVYSYETSIREGFITQFGARVGICGNVLVKGKEICGFSRITGVNIRIPGHFPNVCDDLISHIGNNGFPENAGVLVVSPPGVGKTTVLRELAIRLSRGIFLNTSNDTKVFRVTVVDERYEIYIPELFRGCAVDVLSGIKKSAGLECAARVLSPEVIICDEIGSEADADAISAAHIGGVVFIASMHASSINGVLSKKSVLKLCNDGVFSHIYLLERNKNNISSSIHDIRKYLK